MASASTKIKAVVLDSQTRSLNLVAQETPIPSPDQYLVRVHAVGITKGELQWAEPNSFATSVPGFDVAGTVIKSPSAQSKFQPGDSIYALTTFGRPANAREITLVTEDEIARMPAELSFEEAAAVPMSALTAKEALFDKFGLDHEANASKNKDKSLLVIGASGAVGIWATQLAKWAGVSQVVGVSGPDNVEFVRGLGADHVIDHRQISLADWVSQKGAEGKFDLVLDGVGGQVLSDAWTAVKADGQLVSIVQPPDDSKPEKGVSEGVKGSFFIVNPSGKHLAEITALIEQKLATPVVDGVYALENFQQAFNRADSGRAKGKVIIKTEG